MRVAAEHMEMGFYGNWTDMSCSRSVCPVNAISHISTIYGRLIHSRNSSTGQADLIFLIELFSG